MISPAAASGSGLDALLGRSSTSGGLLEGSAGALPEEEAFRHEAIATGDATLLIRMTGRTPTTTFIAIRSRSIPMTPRFGWNRRCSPEAVAIHDEYFGDTRVYYDQVEIPVYLSRPAGPARQIELTADFQGCLTDGISYPPMSRSVSVDLPEADRAVVAEAAAPLSDTATVAVSEQDRLAAALSGTPVLALLLFLVAGVLLAFTPCVFPMVPILSGLIAGEGDRMSTGRAFSPVAGLRACHGAGLYRDRRRRRIVRPEPAGIVSTSSGAQCVCCAVRRAVAWQCSASMNCSCRHRSRPA